MRFSIALMASGLVAVPVVANAECARFVGTTVDTQDIDEVLQPFVNVGRKDEFETTAAYEARKAQAVESFHSPLIIRKAPEDRKYITYDADTQRLNVASYAFDNAGLNSDALFGYGAPYEGVLRKGITNFEVVIEESEEITDTYRASNAYGAETDVAKVYRRTRGIFEGPARSSAFGLFPSADSRPYIAGSISMAPETAREAKDTITLAFVVVPKAPYFLSAVYDYPNNPTISNPQEVRNEVSVLIGDIQCGLVLASDGEVLGAFETR